MWTRKGKKKNWILYVSVAKTFIVFPTDDVERSIDIVNLDWNFVKYFNSEAHFFFDRSEAHILEKGKTERLLHSVHTTLDYLVLFPGIIADNPSPSASIVEDIVLFLPRKFSFPWEAGFYLLEVKNNTIQNMVPWCLWNMQGRSYTHGWPQNFEKFLIICI